MQAPSPAPSRLALPSGPTGPGGRERHDASWRELVAMLPDIGRLLVALMRDSRVPWHAKAVAGAAVGYVVSPIDVLPDFLPVGLVDDAWVVSRALRHLVSTAGYDLVREHWEGSDDGFALLLILAGVEG